MKKRNFTKKDLRFISPRLHFTDDGLLENIGFFPSEEPSLKKKTNCELLMVQFEKYRDENPILLRRSFQYFGEALCFYKWITLIKVVMISKGDIEIPVDVILVIQSLFLFLSPTFIHLLINNGIDNKIVLFDKSIILNKNGELWIKTQPSLLTFYPFSHHMKMNTNIDESLIVRAERIDNYNFVITPSRLYYQYYNDGPYINDEDIEDMKIPSYFHALEIVDKHGKYVTILKIRYSSFIYTTTSSEKRGFISFKIRYIDNKEEDDDKNGSIFDKNPFDIMKKGNFTIKLPNHRTSVSNPTVRRLYLHDQKPLDECELVL